MARVLLDLVVLHDGRQVEALRTHADPDSGEQLRELLLAAMDRRGHDRDHAQDYQLQVEPVDASDGRPFTFVMTRKDR